MVKTRESFYWLKYYKKLRHVCSFLRQSLSPFTLFPLCFYIEFNYTYLIHKPDLGFALKFGTQSVKFAVLCGAK